MLIKRSSARFCCSHSPELKQVRLRQIACSGVAFTTRHSATLDPDGTSLGELRSLQLTKPTQHANERSKGHWKGQRKTSKTGQADPHVQPQVKMVYALSQPRNLSRGSGRTRPYNSLSLAHLWRSTLPSSRGPLPCCSRYSTTSTECLLRPYTPSHQRRPLLPVRCLSYRQQGVNMTALQCWRDNGLPPPPVSAAGIPPSRSRMLAERVNAFDASSTLHPTVSARSRADQLPLHPSERGHAS